MGSSTRPVAAKPASSSSHAVPAPNEAAAAQYYPAAYWSRCEDPAGDANSAVRARSRQHYPRQWLRQMNNVGLHRLPARPAIDAHNPGGARSSATAGGLVRRTQSGQSATDDQRWPASSVPRRTTISETGPTASPRANCQEQAAAPSGRRAQLVITSWSGGPRKNYLHDLIASDRRYPTVNANGPLTARTIFVRQLPILDPKTNSDVFRCRAGPNTPLALGPGHAAAVKPRSRRPLGR